MSIDTTQFGLDESEDAVYVALLELGIATVTEITKKANITRTLGYHVLERLLQKNLIDEILTKNIKTYKAKHPQHLARYVKKKKQRWKKRAEEVDSLLPELVNLYATDSKPSVRYQEGVKGLTALYEEKLQSSTDILSVLDVESWKTPELWEWTKEYHVRRVRKQVHERILLLDTPEGRNWVNDYYGVPRHTSYRWVSKEYAKKLFQFGGGVDIYEENVMISLINQPKVIGMIIEGGVLANILRAMFELAWESAEPVVFSK